MKKIKFRVYSDDWIPGVPDVVVVNTERTSNANFWNHVDDVLYQRAKKWGVKIKRINHSGRTLSVEIDEEKMRS